jgi:DNA polymerase elongation subunit (family B)
MSTNRNYKTLTEEELNNIEKFLNGHNDKQYVTAVETFYNSNIAKLIIKDKNTRKVSIEDYEYKPFIYLKDLKSYNISLFDNDKERLNKALKKYNITINKLQTKDHNGAEVERLFNGYKYLVETSSKYGFNAIANFFKEGGIDLFRKATKSKTYNVLEVKSKNENDLYINIEDNLYLNLKTNKYEIILKDYRYIEFNSIKVSIKNKKVNQEAEDFDFDDDSDNINKKRYYIEEDNNLRVVIDEEIEVGDKLVLNYNISNRNFYFKLTNDEQFLISTGIRLFKGYETYSDVHKLTLDIETTGLDPKRSEIFLIGIKDNYGFEQVLEGSEKQMIIDLFKTLIKIKPSIILGHNSEEFDFNFILKRAELLGIDLTQIQTTLSKEKVIYKKEGSSVKYGNETHFYSQTIMYGFNVIDTMHSVKRAQAINSDIKSANLKYICKFLDVAKPNRIYINEGSDIFGFYKENKNFIINLENSEYFILPDEYQENPNQYLLDKNLDKNFQVITGKEITKRYLLDDLWETLEVDRTYNESTFLLSKLLPVSFARTATIGGAGTWNLIMTSWSYEKNLAIPYTPKKPKFTGGLSRSFKVGFLTKIAKEDYSGLYPSLELEFDIFPKHDITNALFGILLFLKLNRDKFKKLAKDETLEDQLRKFYDSKQLPLKILNNSNFGALGSEFFNWSDFDCAERITCCGRQYLRLMVDYFMQFGATPAVLDTDGCNFILPKMVDIDEKFNKVKPYPISEFIYFNGKKEEKGVDGFLDCLVDNFNNNVLASPYMKLDNDGLWESAINVSKKNYANLEYDKKKNKYKVKYVGNTIKSRTMPEYIEEFINEGVMMILNNKPKEFIEYYYQYLTKIYLKQVPLKQIASKKRIKESITEYINRGVDKTGKPKAKKAFMELLIENNLTTDNIDYVYVINNGTAKSHGDSKVNKKTGKLYSYMLTKEDIEDNPEQIGDYNVAKYIDSFNTRVEKLLLVFNKSVSDTLLKKDPSQREYYSDSQLELTNYDLDTVQELFTMEEKEVLFWNRTGLNPREIFSNFETVIPLEVDLYIEKLNLVKEKLKETNTVVKAHYERYNNGDVVLTMSDKYYIIENEVEKVIPEKFYRYINNDLYLIPASITEREEYLQFTQDKEVLNKKEFFLCRVKEGELIKIKQI